MATQAEQRRRNSVLDAALCYRLRKIIDLLIRSEEAQIFSSKGIREENSGK